jgi:MFS family permease
MLTAFHLLEKGEYALNNKRQKSMPLWTKDFVSITILNFLIFFAFQMLQPTLPTYVKQLGSGDSIVGLVSGIFTISAIIARPFAGMVLDRIGRKGVFMIGLSVCALSVLAYNWVPIIGIIIIFRLIHGFGWGASSTSSNTIASDCIPQERFGEGMGYFSLASSLAMAIAPAAGLFLVTKYNFHVMFLISVGLIILVFFIAFTINYRKIEKNERMDSKASLYEKASIRPAIVIFFVSVTYGAITSFLVLYTAQRGIENIGFFFTIYALSLLVSRPGFGRITDRFGPNFAIIPGFVCVIIAMVLLSAASTLPMFLISAFIYGIGFGAVQSTMQAMAVANVPPKRRGAATATFFTGFDSGIGFGAMILGSVASAVGYSHMYLCGAVPVVIACILYFIVVRGKVTDPAN